MSPWQEFLCEEHAEVKDEATYEDAKGIRRKRMHDAQPQPAAKDLEALLALETFLTRKQA